jgi:filamentous hemagglutinin family protein
MSFKRYISHAYLAVWITLLGQASPLAASPIPANDGVGTTVTIDGNQYNIGGGELSGDAANLFHSFQQFGLTQSEIANFLSNPQIQNILVRVIGGEASLVDGMLQVSGGASNLFLMNPAGLVFGPNATLNLPADFVATTANGIGFGDNWFNAFGANPYGDLLGSPTGLAFTAAQPGGILNFGDLALNPQQNLILAGGTVASLGDLSVPGGQLVVTAVDGGRAIRISQPGSLLQLEIDVATMMALLPPDAPMSVLSLPRLLTPSGTEVPLEPGDVYAQSATAATIDITAANNLLSVGGEFQSSGDIRLEAVTTLQLRDTPMRPLRINAGQDLQLRGDGQVDILALDHPGYALTSGGDLTLISPQPVSGDAHFAAGGNFSVLGLEGAPADLVSLYDPIISATGDVSFQNYTGPSLKIETLGSITGGNITITGPDVGLTGNDPDIPLLTSGRAAILRAGVNTLANGNNVPTTTGGTAFNGATTATAPGNITVGDISTINTDNTPSTIILRANGQITTANLQAYAAAGTVGNGGTVDVSATNNVTLGSVNTSTGNGTGGSVSVNSGLGDIQFGTIRTFANASGPAGSLTVESGTGNVSGGSINTAAGDGQGGRVDIQTGLGDITLQDIRTNSSGAGDSGDVSVSSGTGTVATGDISTSALGSGAAGDITLNSGTGDITTGTLRGTADDNTGADVTITSGTGNITTNDISVWAFPGTGGNITLSANLGSVTTGDILNRGFGTGSTDGTLNIASGTSEIATGTINFSFANSTSTATIEPPPSSTFVATQAVEADFTKDIESDRSNEFEEYFGRQFERRFVDSEVIRYALEVLNNTTGTNVAVVYVASDGDQAFIRVETATAPVFDTRLDELETAEEPEEGDENADANPNATIGDGASNTDEDQNNEETEEEPRFESIDQGVLNEAVVNFHRAIQRPETNDYRTYASQLYQWLVAPIEGYLEEQGIDTLLFSMESGLRLIPIAALYDENSGQFLSEKYKIAVIPNFGFLDPIPSNLKDADILVMGTSDFQDSDLYPPLDAVPLEMDLIQTIWAGGAAANGQPDRHQFGRNQAFNLENLRSAREERPFQIVHLATHATFRRGVPGDSSIQLWDTELPLNELQIETLDWDDPPVDLLILSACQTALGDDQAELGFAGLSLQAGVKSTLASLWFVSDLGSLVYMMEFYRNLAISDTKAEAVQRTQIAMLDQQRILRNLTEIENRIDRLLAEEGRLSFVSEDASVQRLTQAETQGLAEIRMRLSRDKNSIAERLTHPFYWSSYTLIGSPW